MRKAVSDIIDDVKICIDEIGPNDSEMITGEDNTDMETIIRSKIAEALRFVNINADDSLLDPDTILTLDTCEGAYIDEDTLIGYLPLPDDYIRLCCARLTSWVRYLSDIIYRDDPEYATLFDKFATGTWERPKIAMGDDNTLLFFKAKSTDDDFRAEIMTEPDILSGDDGEYINISPKLYRATIYYIAGLTLLTYKDGHANNMFSQAMALISLEVAQNTTTQES